MLNAAAMMEGKPAWLIVEEGIGLYVQRLGPEERKAIEVVRKAEGKHVTEVRNA